MDLRKEDLISLREAAKLSGYSPDYIGQLIRSGKLPGRQVFSSVAWMTTEEAVLAYMDKKQPESKVSAFKNAIFNLEILTRAYVVAGWALFGVLGVFVLFLAYVAAVSLDHRIEQQSLQNVPYVQ